MATTKDNKLLDSTELTRKLGSTSSTLSTIPNKNEINTAWSGKVHIASTVPNVNTVIPNNGEIWPKLQLKYGSTQYGAYSSSSTPLYYFIKNAQWDSSTIFDPVADSNYYIHEDSTESAVTTNNDYYMKTGSTSPYDYYKVNGSGLIIEKGQYVPPTFSIYPTAIQLNKSTGSTATTSITTNLSNVEMEQVWKYTTSGSSYTDITRDQYIDVTKNLPTVTFQRLIYDSAKPIIIAKFHADGDGYNADDKVLLYPNRSLTTSNITGVVNTQTTITPDIKVDGDLDSTATSCLTYTMSQPNSTDSWITINNTTKTITVSANTGSARTSNTIRVTGSISNIIDNISFTESLTYADFTITQNAATPSGTPLYVVIRRSTPTTWYLSTSNSSIVTPATPIFANGISRVQVTDVKINIGGVDGTDYTANIIISGVNTSGNVSWSPTLPSGAINPTIVDYGKVELGGSFAGDYYLGDTKVQFI